MEATRKRGTLAKECFNHRGRGKSGGTWTRARGTRLRKIIQFSGESASEATPSRRAARLFSRFLITRLLASPPSARFVVAILTKEPVFTDISRSGDERRNCATLRAPSRPSDAESTRTLRRCSPSRLPVSPSHRG